MPRNRLPRVMKHYSTTGRRNHGRLLKRLLDTLDRNGSTSGPTPWHIWRWWWWWWWWWQICTEKKPQQVVFSPTPYSVLLTKPTLHCKWRQDISFGLVTGLGLNDAGFKFRNGHEIFLFSKNVHNSSGAHRPSYSKDTGFFFLSEVKRLGREWVTQLHLMPKVNPYSANVENMVSS